MRVLTNLPLHVRLLLASSRKLSAGPVVSGSDSAAPTRFWFFCALSKFSVESLIILIWTSRNIYLTVIQNIKTVTNYIVSTKKFGHYKSERGTKNFISFFALVTNELVWERLIFSINFCILFSYFEPNIVTIKPV